MKVPPPVHKLYQYVGPEDLEQLAETVGRNEGCPVLQRKTVREWMVETNQVPDGEGEVTVTFVISEEGVLRISDRHQEHVVCADYRPVMSAGEMTFILDGDDVSVVHVTNQSTGFCPEPASWPAVASALESAGFEAPEGFDVAIEFRRCEECGQTILVKEAIEDDPECPICGSALPELWNF